MLMSISKSICRLFEKKKFVALVIKNERTYETDLQKIEETDCYKFIIFWSDKPNLADYLNM
jgi:hypothetical protein